MSGWQGQQPQYSPHQQQGGYAPQQGGFQGQPQSGGYMQQPQSGGYQQQQQHIPKHGGGGGGKGYQKFDSDSDEDEGYLGIVKSVSKNFKSNMRVAESIKGNGSLVEVEEYKHLRGQGAASFYYKMKMGMRYKRVKITMNNGNVLMESGALHYMEGNIEIHANIGGVGGLVKKKIQNKLTKEATIKPKYTGTGIIYLEPSWGYYALVYLNQETAVVDKGFYYASEGTIQIGVARQKNFSAGFFGGEGWFQTKLSGTGWVVLTVPVPPEEIHKFKLSGSSVKVDGSFAILRKGAIEFSVKRSTKGLVGSVASGEGMLQTFTGTGEVWVCPTMRAYGLGIYSASTNRG
eukprot:TRINITY_DN1456_c0_g1_i1.p2 TRINITY_DN1456_c0_g1~~TRINITY_DN1456_c0_g1_i1.p2  ORF type:complete len:346 (-),score=62.55 TRINITY_DN1456_c0_g1_i1:4-1041(-)